MEQNIQIRNKLNEVNHDYQVLRRRATLRRANRLRKADALKRKHEADIRRTLGVDSYMSRQRDRDNTIEAYLIAIAIFVFLYACLCWVVL